MSDQEDQDRLAVIDKVWGAGTATEEERLWADLDHNEPYMARAVRDIRWLRAEVTRLTQENARLKAGWQPIATAPESRILLLFAVTDTADDGTVRNWKMATGSWSLDYHGKQKEWTWDGHRLKGYDHQPTHWLPLPAAPSA